MKEWKLKIDLIPQPSHYKNLRNDIGQYKWGKIRKAVYARQNHKCAICDDSPKRLYCHEIWEFQKETEVQKLVGFKAVCGKCNLSIHFGFAQIQASQGFINLDEIIKHFIKVNKCTRKEFDKHKKEAADIYMELSMIDWKIDYEGYETLV